MAKENSTKLQREPTVWENIFANDTSDKGLSPHSICKKSPNVLAALLPPPDLSLK